MDRMGVWRYAWVEIAVGLMYVGIGLTGLVVGLVAGLVADLVDGLVVRGLVGEIDLGLVADLVVGSLVEGIEHDLVGTGLGVEIAPAVGTDFGLAKEI
jgi:hypothetical protein